MNLSAKTEYACIAALDLAVHYGADDPVRVRDIATRHGIPSPFLVQILLQLKGAGLVESTRGAAGGYRLSKDPDSITLADVMAVIEGPANELCSSATSGSPLCHVLVETWREVDVLQREMLANVTLHELTNRLQGRTAKMYYI